MYRLAPAPIQIPAVPPSNANTPLSIRCWRNNRILAAPRARRTADSRCLLTERASSRFATFTQTISTSTPTSSIRIHSALASFASSRSNATLARQRDQLGNFIQFELPAGKGGKADPPIRVIFAARAIVRAWFESHPHGQGRVNIGPLARRRTKKTRRGHSHDAHGHIVNPGVPVQCGSVSSQPAHPEAMAHNDDRFIADAVFAFAEGTPNKPAESPPLERSCC